jgi:hypothetical protein
MHVLSAFSEELQALFILSSTWRQGFEYLGPGTEHSEFWSIGPPKSPSQETLRPILSKT